MGWVAQWSFETVKYIPHFVSWGILLVCIVGVILMPASGFWLGIPVAIVMTRLGPPNKLELQEQSA